MYGLGSLIGRGFIWPLRREVQQLKSASGEAIGAYLAFSLRLGENSDAKGGGRAENACFQPQALEQIPRLLNAARNLEITIPDIEEAFQRFKRDIRQKEVM